MNWTLRKLGIYIIFAMLCFDNLPEVTFKSTYRFVVIDVCCILRDVNYLKLEHIFKYTMETSKSYHAPLVTIGL